MPSVGMRTDISSLIDATAVGNTDQIIAVARELTQRGANASELIGRVGMIAARGDSEGHTILTLDAASMMCRWLLALQYTLAEDALDNTRGLPFLVQALAAASQAVRTGKIAQNEYPAPLFPSGLAEGQTVNSAMHNAVFGNDRTMVERLMLGLYGTGADYRAMQIRVYDSISTTFQYAGHPFMFAVRGMQLLDAVEWGDRAPNIIHWLAPHLPLHSEEPDWVNPIRSFLSEPGHSLASYRTRLAAPKEENALPLRHLIQSNAETLQICQGVYDALITNGASSRGVGSIIALTATDLIQRVGDGDRNEFINAAHSLLFTAAVRLVFSQTQEVDALPLLFIAASYLNALHKEMGEQIATAQPPGTRTPILGGGLIAPALLDTLSEQLDAQDLSGAFSTARRYLQLGHDARSLFAVIGLSSAKTDAAADQGHTMQIVQAAGEEYLAWPTALTDTMIEGFVHVALRATAFAKRNSLVENLE
ncbi:MAG TPA: hypothetical protein VEH81_14415 [Ktedonobacteraceae bacterium]|nr:hypothetical protein [Ktedonobacteraceae bacterium]